MSVARAGRLEPLQEFDLPVNKAALVVGGGIAGMTCALSIARQGHEVHLVEKEAELGGSRAGCTYTLDGLDVQAYVRDLVNTIYRHPSIHVYTHAEITEATGYVGNFVTTVKHERAGRADQTRRRRHRHRGRCLPARRIPLRRGREGHDPPRAGGADRRGDERSSTPSGW
jgi:heterodisulfide reductase subunit A-like polyferredoxin